MSDIIGPTPAMVKAVQYVMRERVCYLLSDETAHAVCHAVLTAPKTKKIWCVTADSSPCGFSTDFDEWRDAANELAQLVAAGHRVTVERREVPA